MLRCFISWYYVQNILYMSLQHRILLLINAILVPFHNSAFLEYQLLIVFMKRIVILTRTFILIISHLSRWVISFFGRNAHNENPIHFFYETNQPIKYHIFLANTLKTCKFKWKIFIPINTLFHIAVVTLLIFIFQFSFHNRKRTLDL